MRITERLIGFTPLALVTVLAAGGAVAGIHSSHHHARIPLLYAGPLRHVPLVPDPDQRVVGQYGVQIAVPRTWPSIEPRCFVPKVPGYVAFYSARASSCPTEVAGDEPPPPSPPSVMFSRVKDLYPPRPPMHPYSNEHGLVIERSTTTCDEYDDYCQVLFIVGRVVVTVGAPRASVDGVADEIGATLDSLPTDEVAIPYQEPVTKRAKAARVLTAAGLSPVQDDPRARDDYGSTKPGPGTIVARGSRVVIIGDGLIVTYGP